MSKTCPNCAMLVRENDTVCSNCGADLTVHKHQGDETQPMVGAVGRTGDLTHRLSKYERDMTFDKVGAGNSAKIGGSWKEKRGTTGLLVPILVVALVVSLATILQMSKRLTEMEATVREAQLQNESERSVDSLVAEDPPPTDSDSSDVRDDAGVQRDSEGTVDGEASGGEMEDESPSEPAKKKKYYGLIGTWTGTLQQPDRRAYCYGASEMPMVLEVKDVADTGMITADLHLCFHGHKDLDNSAESADGDRALDYKDVILTYSNGKIRYDIERLNQYPDYYTKLTVELGIDGIDGASPQISGYVYSCYDWDFQYDYFEFAKSSS